jgi:aromatic-L-amino-acid decarboxylase
MEDYLEQKENYRVTPGVAPQGIINQLSLNPSKKGESFDLIMQDFKEIIVLGMTHW